MPAGAGIKNEELKIKNEEERGTSEEGTEKTEGKLSFKEGDVITLMDGKGGYVDVTVIGDGLNENGEVTVEYPDGGLYTYKPEDLQKESDLIRKQKAEEFDRTMPATVEEQKSAIQKIVNLAKNVKNKIRRAVIGGITERQKSDFARAGIEGVDETWVHSIENSAVRHNQKHHADAASEQSRGQGAVTEEDYQRIPDILENYDRVSKSPNRNGADNDVIIYEKEFDDGYVYYLEEKRDRRKSLAFQTMYKKKKGTDSSDGLIQDDPALTITPEATPDNLSSEGKGSDFQSEKQGKSDSEEERELRTENQELRTENQEARTETKEAASGDQEAASGDDLEVLRLGVRGRSEQQDAAVLERGADGVRVWSALPIDERSERAEGASGYVTILNSEEAESAGAGMKNEELKINNGDEERVKSGENKEPRSETGEERTEKAETARENEDIDSWFGPVYTEFQGKGKEAEDYLREKCEGTAKGALTYPGLSPIDLAWGNLKAGYMKIVIKHPEVVGKLQEILNAMKITSQSDNRIVLESDTHKVVISKKKGATPTDNWLLTAYEKKEKPVSASSSDIETEPEGMRNGTATPQNELSSGGKGSNLPSDKQASGAESSEAGAGGEASESAGGEAQGVPVAAAPEVRVPRKARTQRRRGRSRFGSGEIGKRMQQAAREMSDCPEALEILNDMDPHTIEEAAAEALSIHKLLLNDKGVKRGFRRMTGYSQETAKRLFGLFASAENGGISLERLAEDVMQGICEENGIHYENDLALTALMDVIQSCRTYGDIRSYIRRARLDQAESYYDRWKRAGGMSPEEAEYYEGLEGAEEQEQRTETGEQRGESGADSFFSRGGEQRGDEADPFGPTIPDEEVPFRAKSEEVRGESEEVERMLSGLHHGGVRVVRSVDELPEGGLAWRAIRDGKRVTGWYSEQQNAVYLYAPNIRSVDELQRTLRHEGVAHMGLRELLGQDRFGDLCDRVWQSVMSAEDRWRYVAYVKNLDVAELRGKSAEELAEIFGSESVMRAAADEYMAWLGEDGSYSAVSRWEKFKSWVRDALRGLGFDLRLTDGDVLALLRRSDREFFKEDSEEERVKSEEAERMRMAEDKDDFEAMQKRAEEERGLVIPGLREMAVKVVSVPRHDFAGSHPIKQAENWAREHIAGAYKASDNEGREFTYNITNNAISKYLSSKAVSVSANLGIHLSVLKKLPDIIGSSVEAEVHPDYAKGSDGSRSVNKVGDKNLLIHRFYGAVEIDGKVYRVKTTMHESNETVKGVRAYSYEVTKIELLDEPMAGVENATVNIGRNDGDSKARLSDNSISVAKLLKGVEKSYDRGVNLLDASVETGGDRLRFIGEKGAKRLDERDEATTRLDNLSVARAMEKSGRDAKAVKMATGWERGADGKWRYETADFKRVDKRGELHPERRRLTGAEAAELNDDDSFDAYCKGLDVLSKQGHENASDEEILIAGGLDREKAQRWVALNEKKQSMKQTPKTLDDYVDDDELFTEYPELRNVKVEENSDVLLDGKHGSYDSKTNTLYWNDAEEGTLAHEVQHIIQRYENFAKGGNPSITTYMTSKSEGVYDALKWMQQEIESSRVEFRKAKAELDELNAKMADIYKRADAGEISEAECDRLINELAPEYEKVNKRTSELGRNISHQKRQYDEMFDSLDNPIGQEGYEALSGEVEARNAQARMGMSDEERRASLASETEDVAREDQIFIRDGLSVPAEMGSRVPKRRAKVKELLKDADLTEEQRKIINVFTGDSRSARLTIDGKNGDCKLYVRRGNENNAGTDHCLYGHFDTNKGVVTANELHMIPDVIRNGERSAGNRKGIWKYTLKRDGVEYTVITESGDSSEVFNDFYTNRKGSAPALSTRQEAHIAIETKPSDGAKVRKNSESSETGVDNILFRRVGDDDKTLVGVHNISEEKLLKALKLGGLANPSAAVIDLRKSGHDGYGEISLVMPSSLVDKRTGRNAGTWAADAYTPRFPSTHKAWSDKSYRQFGKDMAGLSDGMGSRMWSAMQEYIENGNSPRGLSYLFLHERGEAPETVRRGSKYPDEVVNAVKKLGDINHSTDKMTEDELNELARIYVDYKYGADKKEMFDDKITVFEALKEMDPELDTVKGIGLGKLDHFRYDVLRSDKDAGEVDGRATEDKAWNIVSENGLRDEFEKWLGDKEQEYGVSEYLFGGYTPSGNRRDIPLTLENVSKLMKKDGRAGAENFFHDSPGGVRAQITKRIDTLEAMRKNKSRLVTSNEFAAIKEAINNKYFELAQRLFRNDTGELADVLTSKDMQRTAAQYGVGLGEKSLKELKEFRDFLAEAPTEYFETKFERPVGLGEFATAVVPSDVSPDVRRALERAGLGVEEYERGNSESRKAALERASEGEGIRFRIADDEDKEERRAVNERFNKQLDAFVKGNKRQKLVLGRPGSKLRAIGLNSTEMFITPNTLRSHLDKHSLTIEDIKDLPEAVNNPIMAYTWGTKAKSLIVITDMQRGDQRIAVAVKLERNGKAVEVNEIASVHGKDIEKVLTEMSTEKSDFGRDNLKYVDKEKAADWLRLLVPPKGTASLTDQQLRAAKIIKDFENPKIGDDLDDLDEGTAVRFRTETAEQRSENSEQRTESGEERAETGGKRSFGDRLLDVAVRMARRHAEDLGLRDAAVEALGERIGNLRKAMQAQQGYDFISLMFICDQYGAYYRLHKKRAATEYYDS